MRPAPRTLACGLVSLLTLGSLRVEASGAEPMPPRKVALAILAPRGESRALLVSVGELLGRLGLTVVPSPAGEAVLASVVVQCTEVECAVSIARPAGPVLQLRRVPRGSSSPVTTEAVAHVVQSLVEELAEADLAPASPKADPPAPPSTGAAVVVESLAPAPLEVALEPGDGRGLELGAWVSGRAVTDQALFVPGGGLASAWRFPSWGVLGPAVAVSAGYHGAFAASSALVTTGTQSVSLRLMAQARYSLGGALSLVAGVGAGTDIFITSTSSEFLEPSEYRAESVEVAPVVTAAFGVRGRVSPRVALFASLSADLDLAPRRYLTLVQGTRSLLFETWRVRPTLAVGFTFELWGAP